MNLKLLSQICETPGAPGYEKRIRNLRITSNLPNVEDYLGSFRKNMTNTGFLLFLTYEVAFFNFLKILSVLYSLIFLIPLSAYNYFCF